MPAEAAAKFARFAGLWDAAGEPDRGFTALPSRPPITGIPAPKGKGEGTTARALPSLGRFALPLVALAPLPLLLVGLPVGAASLCAAAAAPAVGDAPAGDAGAPSGPDLPPICLREGASLTMACPVERGEASEEREAREGSRTGAGAGGSSRDGSPPPAELDDDSSPAAAAAAAAGTAEAAAEGEEAACAGEACADGRPDVAPALPVPATWPAAGEGAAAKAASARAGDAGLTPLGGALLGTPAPRPPPAWGVPAPTAGDRLATEAGDAQKRKLNPRCSGFLRLGTLPGFTRCEPPNTITSPSLSSRGSSGMSRRSFTYVPAGGCVREGAGGSVAVII